MKLTSIILTLALLALPIAAHAEPNWGGGKAYGGGAHSNVVGPNGYHDPAAPTKVTSSSLAAYGAAVLARIGR